MADRFKLTFYLRCSAEDASRLYAEAADDLFCDCHTHLGGVANPDHMTRVLEPCRHELSTMAPFREQTEVFLDLTKDEALALADLLAPCTDPTLRAVGDQLSDALAAFSDVPGAIRPVGHLIDSQPAPRSEIGR